MKELTGAERLRKYVAILNNCRESFNDRFAVHELISLAEACLKSDWDILPDAWAADQVSQALQGVVPRWADEQTPLYWKRGDLVSWQPPGMRGPIPATVVLIKQNSQQEWVTKIHAPHMDRSIWVDLGHLKERKEG